MKVCGDWQPRGIAGFFEQPEPLLEARAATLDLMAEETREIRPGSAAVVSRLCDILVIQAIRTWIEEDPAARTGWLGALSG